MIHLAPNVTESDGHFFDPLLKLSVVHQIELRFRMATITTLFYSKLSALEEKIVPEWCLSVTGSTVSTNAKPNEK